MQPPILPGRAKCHILMCKGKETKQSSLVEVTKADGHVGKDRKRDMLKTKTKLLSLCLVVHICNSIAWEVETGRIRSSKSFSAIW